MVELSVHLDDAEAIAFAEELRRCFHLSESLLDRGRPHRPPRRIAHLLLQQCLPAEQKANERKRLEIEAQGALTEDEQRRTRLARQAEAERKRHA